MKTIRVGGAAWVFLLLCLSCAAPSVLAKPAKKARPKPKPKVTFVNECTCKGNHGLARWDAKTDTQKPPDQADEWDVADICAQGGMPMLNEKSPRNYQEEKFVWLRGIPTLVKVEADGDVHVELESIDGSADCRVVVEIPAGNPWCLLRKEVFDWVDATFPFKITSNKVWKIPDRQVVGFIGKLFYDVDHAPKGASGNRRPNERDLAVWEVHPVMLIIEEGKKQ